MTDRLFQWLDWSCDAFLKLVVATLFVACGIYLAVTGGTLGLCLFLMLGSFLKWAFADSGASSPLDEEEV
ncbi:hypothetical protein [Kordiimonas aestuarii]|uniref:hypothetical protein n=1 Tax=Kordiimonas aestuarii TaxID=1005925 RepID=UPI0021CE7CA7|nr:hypothetical protein [Kordiimonas aestuarii]